MADELTEAFSELRILFPVKVERNRYGSNKTRRSIHIERNEFAESSGDAPNRLTVVKIRIAYAEGGYSAPLVVTAPTLPEAMAQVRSWKAAQDAAGER